MIDRILTVPGPDEKDRNEQQDQSPVRLPAQFFPEPDGVAILRNIAGDRYEVCSAGFVGRPIHPLVYEVMKGVGITVKGQHSKTTREYMGSIHFSHAIVLCEIEESECPKVYPFTLNLLYWPFEDPTVFEGTREEKMQKFRDVRNQIGMRIKGWLTEMKGREP